MNWRASLEIRFMCDYLKTFVTNGIVASSVNGVKEGTFQSGNNTRVYGDGNDPTGRKYW